MSEQPIFHGNLKVADTRLFDGKGRDVMTLPGGPQRLADCANALKDVFFPLAHVPAMENRIERLEQLRKEAVARIPEDGRYDDTPETASELPQTPESDRWLSVAEIKDATGRQSADPLRAERGRPGEGVTAGETAPHSTSDGRPEGGKRLQVTRWPNHAAEPDAVQPKREEVEIERLIETSVTGGESAATHSTTSALLRHEPAGEAPVWPWRFDMENAPRGSHTISTRQTKDGPREVKTPKREVIFVAGEDGHVTQSYWVPEAERWCMFTKESPPIAWVALPTFPAKALQSEAA